ncbi:MAG TPA: 16S rRNA (cytidine(1402)-2'-O)-methyltransferase [Gammaproteobacteria bacterium]
MKQAALYIVATPIGNLADISQRAIEVLANVDLIAAEDTRHSRHLLQHYNIRTPAQSYHEHNEEQQTPKLIDKLLAGMSIALISDAGTPLLSDPGYRLVRTAHEAGIAVIPLPGPCAAIAALSASGLPTDRYCFYGFPPVKSVARKHFYESLNKINSSLVFYESSHRILASLGDMVEAFGGVREAVLARELTKTFETIRKATLAELYAWVSDSEQQRKGEFVLMVAGSRTEEAESTTVELEQLLSILLEELPLSTATQLAAKITGMKKNRVYKTALEMQSI